MVRFTPQKPACHSNHSSTYANQTEARHRQPPRQMGMASHVDRRRGADSLPESLTTRKVNHRGSTRYHAASPAVHVTIFRPQLRQPWIFHLARQVDTALAEAIIECHIVILPLICYHHQLTSPCSRQEAVQALYMLTARRGATLATRSSPDPTSTKARSADVKTTPLIVDSGATVSIVNDRKLLANIREIPPTTVGGIGAERRSWRETPVRSGGEGRA